MATKGTHVDTGGTRAGGSGGGAGAQTGGGRCYPLHVRSYLAIRKGVPGSTGLCVSETPTPGASLVPYPCWYTCSPAFNTLAEAPRMSLASIKVEN